MANQKYNILYGRLSQEDELKGDSNSIQNQRMLLEKYARENGFTNEKFLYDDGYSGTNFNRPAWNEVMKLIENSEVETLIVKDLSRLGREYLQVGYYTEIYFPQRGVRFIAVNDGVDSLYSETNDFTPMRNYFNELYAKDSSKKVRIVKRAQAERGELLGGRPPYGYKRDENIRKGVVPDEEAAGVVKRIFGLCAEGKGPNQIARILTKEQVMNPCNYYYRKTGASHRGLDTTRPYHWSGSTVTGILDNKTYLGHMAGLRSTTLSYKNKKLIRHPESEQILVENTHEPLITQELWDIVQDVRQHKKRTPKQMDEPNMFSGLVYCADCGKTLVLHRAHTMKATQNNFMCYTYKKKGKEVCTAHYIREQDLTQIILDDLRRVTHFARQKERLFAEYINRKNSAELRREINTVQKELDTMRHRNTELTALFKRLYEDNVLGRVTNEQFRILSGDYNVEQKELSASIPEKEARLEKLKDSAANVEAFIEKAKRYTEISELTPEILRLFISRIEVGERGEKYSRTAEQSIRILYRDVGVMDSVVPIEENMEQENIA
ncbi:recombinase family protein [Marasmitruncus massiliensis]|jgi:site-specific DNA recombinase|uniref:recombinase family protein n=1 Tax=Marasmitruncus massiliensis TaxID=1944642 RepID=UPI000C7B7E77|nr:recombinase family protein [Marasmitruncus massiliensis]MDD4145404.1 recombinase family protein [Prolixibacteraceae bacterium]